MIAAVAAPECGEEHFVGLALKENPLFVLIVVIPGERDHIPDAGVHDAVDGETCFQRFRVCDRPPPAVVKGHGRRADDERDEYHDRHCRDHLYKRKSIHPQRLFHN